MTEIKDIELPRPCVFGWLKFCFHLVPSSATPLSIKDNTVSDSTRKRVTISMVRPFLSGSLINSEHSAAISGQTDPNHSSKRMTSGCISLGNWTNITLLWPPDSCHWLYASCPSPTRSRISQPHQWLLPYYALELWWPKNPDFAADVKCNGRVHNFENHSDFLTNQRYACQW